MSEELRAALDGACDGLVEEVAGMIGASSVQRMALSYAEAEMRNRLASIDLPAPRASTDAAPVAWMPIETAPKDGTTIDVWRDGTRETVYWGFPPHCCGEMGQHCDSDWHSLKEPGWICSTFGEYVGGEHDPFTHWKPIDRGPSAHPPVAAAAVAGEVLGRFGHHPEASIDYECEVDVLIAMAYDRLTGMREHADLEDRIRKALEFRALETPLELRWLNQHFNGAREVYAKMPDCIAQIADKVGLSYPTTRAEPAQAIAIGRKLDAEDGGYPAPGDHMELAERIKRALLNDKSADAYMREDDPVDSFTIDGTVDLVAIATELAKVSSEPVGLREALNRLEAIREVVAAAYYACEDSEDDGGQNIHVMRSSWQRLSDALDKIDEIMPDAVQPALPAAIVSLVIETLSTLTRTGEASAEGEGRS